MPCVDYARIMGLPAFLETEQDATSPSDADQVALSLEVQERSAAARAACARVRARRAWKTWTDDDRANETSAWKTLL